MAARKSVTISFSRELLAAAEMLLPTVRFCFSRAMPTTDWRKRHNRNGNKLKFCIQMFVMMPKMTDYYQILDISNDTYCSFHCNCRAAFDRSPG